MPKKGVYSCLHDERDILKYLHEKSPRNIGISDQALSTAMQRHVILEKHRYDGRDEDIKWSKAQIFRNHANLRGYRIDFVGASKQRAFVIIKTIVDGEKKSPEAVFTEKNRFF